MMAKVAKASGRRTRWVALGIAALLIGLSGGQIIAADMGDSSIAKCGPVDPAGFTNEDHPYAPYEARLTQLPSMPIASLGSSTDRLAAQEAGGAIDGLAARWVVRTETGSAYHYFFGLPLDARLTPEEFWAQGGVQLDMDPLTGDVPFWQIVKDQFPALVSPVRIGQYDGVVVWADPASNGVRTHNVYWSDGRYNYGLIADRPVATAVNLARGWACNR